MSNVKSRKPLTQEQLASRFWPKVAKSEGCWLWTASTSTFGHGQLWSGPSILQAHRVSWMLANGAIPEGMCVLHRCDNPPCVNPDHLFLGTVADNLADMTRKGRRRWGRPKLTPDDVRAIRALRAAGETKATIAARFNLCLAATQNVLVGKTWKSVR